MSSGALALGACIALSSCGSSGDDAPTTAGGSNGEAGASGKAGSLSIGGASAGNSAAGDPGSAGQVNGAGAGAPSEGGAAGASVSEPEVLDPPPSIDLFSCAASDDSPGACDGCCHDKGFSASSTYQGKCVCGAFTEDDVACATETAIQCFGCCASAGYAGTNFVQSEPSQCTCQYKFDTTVCASAQNTAKPAPACAICCLNKGYLASDYDAEGRLCKCASL